VREVAHNRPTQANKAKNIMTTDTKNPSNLATQAKVFFNEGAKAGKLGFITSKEIALNMVLNQFIDQLKYVSSDYIQFKDESLIIFKTGTISIVKSANFGLDFYTQVQSKLA
jgi:hypothetical protein